MDNTIDVLTNGFVRLDAVHADDLSVANAARVSFGKKKDTLEQEDEKLIAFLMREQHGTPFEHNFFRFHIKAPIFVAREWFRHRIGWSYNEFSARYSQMPTEAYMPQLSQMRTQTGKPGAYTFETMENGQLARDRMRLAYTMAFNAYDQLLAQGVAKEVARNVLPVATYTEFYATTNARALMNFIQLRSAETAQWEIRQYSHTLEKFLSDHMPHTYSNFVQNERTAP